MEHGIGQGECALDFWRKRKTTGQSNFSYYDQSEKNKLDLCTKYSLDGDAFWICINNSRVNTERENGNWIENEHNSDLQYIWEKKL